MAISAWLYATFRESMYGQGGFTLLRNRVLYREPAYPRQVRDIRQQKREPPMLLSNVITIHDSRKVA